MSVLCKIAELAENTLAIGDEPVESRSVATGSVAAKPRTYLFIYLLLTYLGL